LGGTDTQYTEVLQYSKANYATEPALANVDQISNVLFGKRVRDAFLRGRRSAAAAKRIPFSACPPAQASQPVVMLFVSSDSEDRKQVMVRPTAKIHDTTRRRT
jgi:hypothetical protein